MRAWQGRPRPQACPREAGTTEGTGLRAALGAGLGPEGLRLLSLPFRASAPRLPVRTEGRAGSVLPGGACEGPTGPRGPGSSHPVEAPQECPLDTRRLPDTSALASPGEQGTRGSMAPAWPWQHGQSWGGDQQQGARSLTTALPAPVGELRGDGTSVCTLGPGVPASPCGEKDSVTIRSRPGRQRGEGRRPRPAPTRPTAHTCADSWARVPAPVRWSLGAGRGAALSRGARF